MNNSDCKCTQKHQEKSLPSIKKFIAYLQITTNRKITQKKILTASEQECKKISRLKFANSDRFHACVILRYFSTGTWIMDSQSCGSA